MKLKVLPIGSVVLLNGGTKKVMINGYSSRDNNSGVLYDYNGCVFPEGFMENKFCLFNKDQISEVCFIGYLDDEFEEYLNDTDSILTASSGGKSASDGVSGETKKKVGRRTPKAPTKPMSKEEMKRKYGVAKESSENYEIPED